jgi:hypothetical protein
MSELPLDLDNILAYLVPGFIALLGLTFLSPRLRRLFGAIRGKRSGSALLALLLAALVTGLLISDLRVPLLHWTAGRDLSYLPFCHDEESFQPIPKEKVDYGKLTDEGHLHAFQEAKRNEQTPYRFHGDAFVAVLIFVAARIIALCRDAMRHTIERRALIRGIALSALILVAALPVLYIAFRTHYFNYVTAINRIS